MNYTYTNLSKYSYRYSKLFFGWRSIYKLIRPEKLLVGKLERKLNAREIQPGIFQNYINLILLLCASSCVCLEHFRLIIKRTLEEMGLLKVQLDLKE